MKKIHFREMWVFCRPLFGSSIERPIFRCHQGRTAGDGQRNANEVIMAVSKVRHYNADADVACKTT